MSFDYPTRVQVGTFLVALLAVMSNLITFREVNSKPGGAAQDAVSAFEARMQPIRRDLPSHGQVGYIADEQAAGDDRAALLHFREFCYAQYTLAPVTLIDSPGYPLVIGNFHRSVTPERVSKLKLILVKDYGNGIILLLVALAQALPRSFFFYCSSSAEE